MEIINISEHITYSVCCAMLYINPLNPDSDHKNTKISPCDIKALPNRVVTRIKERITRDEFA